MTTPTTPDLDAMREQDRCPLCGEDTTYAVTLAVHLSEHHDTTELAAEIQTLRNRTADRDSLAAEVERLQQHNDTIFSENQTLGYEIGQLTTSLAERDALAADLAETHAEFGKLSDHLARKNARVREVIAGRDALAAEVERLTEKLGDRPRLGDSINRHADRLIIEARTQRDAARADAGRLRERLDAREAEVERLNAALTHLHDSCGQTVERSA